MKSCCVLYLRLTTGADLETLILPESCITYCVFVTKPYQVKSPCETMELAFDTQNVLARPIYNYTWAFSQPTFIVTALK